LEKKMKFDDIIRAVTYEVGKASKKFPTWPSDPLHASAVVEEECGELTKAILETIYEPHKSDVGDVREEAIQTAAMAIRFLLSMDRYVFAPVHQHKQGEDNGQS
jgi:NTP pyrophosphatase (non-canonical NTP hydrolase)